MYLTKLDNLSIKFLQVKLGEFLFLFFMNKLGEFIWPTWNS
jgi:hypothetical protein